MRRGIAIFLTLIAISFFSACDKTPDHVIESEKMEDLLIDIHRAEVYMENDRYIAGSKAAQDSIKNSIFAKHSITKADFDTSMVWYGKNLDKFIEIYNNVIIRLQSEDNRLLALINEKSDMYTGITRSGDTVDIWNRNPHYIFEGKLNNNLLSFLIPYDDNFKDDDFYKLKFKVLSPNRGSYYPQVILATKDKKNITKFVKKEIRSTGWDSLELQTKGSIKKVSGSFYVPADPVWKITHIDSISLERIHTKEK